MNALLLALAFLATGQTAEPGAALKDDKTVKALEKVAKELLEAHNRERAAQKLPPLTLDDRLCRAAAAHAHDMAQHKEMSHSGSDKSQPVDRIVREKYRYVTVGENVATGQETVKEVMTAWMNSPAHRDNILADFTQIGAGVYQDQEGAPYWCVDFGTPIPKLEPASAANDLFDRINEVRTAAEKPKLKASPRLDQAALAAARAYAKKKTIEDESIDPADFVKREGYRFESLSQSGSKGAPTPKILMESILKDEDQKKQYLGDLPDVGIGYAQDDEETPYWIIIFAKEQRRRR